MCVCVCQRRYLGLNWKKKSFKTRRHRTCYISSIYSWRRPFWYEAPKCREFTTDTDTAWMCWLLSWGIDNSQSLAQQAGKEIAGRDKAMIPVQQSPRRGAIRIIQWLLLGNSIWTLHHAGDEQAFSRTSGVECRKTIYRWEMRQRPSGARRQLRIEHRQPTNSTQQGNNGTPFCKPSHPPIIEDSEDGRWWKVLRRVAWERWFEEGFIHKHRG